MCEPPRRWIAAPRSRSDSKRRAAEEDPRFATLDAVVNQYDGLFKLNLTPQQKRDLVEYLKSL